MKRKFILYVFCLILISVNAQNTLHYLSSTTGAACYAIKYYNGYIFTGTGSTLRSYYVGTGATVPYDSIFEYRYSSEIIRMAVHDHYLFIAANYDGMGKWDISNPALPVKIYDIPCDSTGMATQGIAFKGDTILLAQQSKVQAYRDYGTTYSKIKSFGYAPIGGVVSGIAAKNNLLAYTIWQAGPQNGVYLYNVNTFSFISFTQQGNFLTENVIWGKNNNLLHVMGGTNTTNGHFYTLDVSNPSSPQMIFSDTVLGIPYGASMALPYNAENINDTIYVANWGGLKPGNLNNCFIRVYDATNPSNVHLLTYINAGLWHFDLTVHYPKIYIASEWYGIKTADVTNIMNPVDDGNTLTGGWNLSADTWGNYMTVADEGYGYKLYDITDVHHPHVLKLNNDPGFCRHANFSEDGNYIYTANMTTQGFRAYTRDSLHQISYITQIVCNGRFIVNHNRIFSKLDNKLIIINVGDPYNPVIDSTITMTYNDMAVANNVLYITNNDSIFAYDISGSNFNEIAKIALASNQDAQMLAAYNDKIYVYITNKGLTRYKLVYNSLSYSLNEEYYSVPVNGAPTFIAADTFGLYLAYRLYGLYALDRQTFAQTGYYRGGLDYRKYTTMYGVQDLVCKNNLVFLVEYFAQTSILSNDSLFTGTYEPSGGNDKVQVYPNPVNDKVFIHVNNSDKNLLLQLFVYDVNGKLQRNIYLNKEYSEIDISDLSAGLYLLCFRDDNALLKSLKIIKQ
ncbi:MAG: T9SS type A sorting domain-containing protein [Bacteroidales bacterium]